MLDTTAPPEADWDLSQLYGGLDDPQIGIDQRSITKRVQAYAGMVRAMVDDLSRPDVMLVVLEGLAALQREELYVEARHDEELYFGCKPEYYAALYASRWPTNAEARALEGRIREWAAGLRESLDFVFVAIGRVPMAGQEALLADDLLAGYHTWLRRRFATGAYDLSKAVEPAADALRMYGIEIPQRQMLRAIVPGLTASVDGQNVTYPDLMQYLTSGNSAVRADAQSALGEMLEAGAPVAIWPLDTVIGTRTALAKLRGSGDPLALACLDSGLNPATIRAMLDTVAGHFASVREYNTLRAKAFSQGQRPTLSYPDRLRSLPVGNASTREYSWKEACDLVRDMWARLDPAYATMFDDAIASGHVFTGSRRSAACWWAPGQPPFLELNFGGTFRDVVRLAHEYGHYIAARLIFAHQNGLNDNPSVPMCEIPSVVVEQLLIQALDGEAGQADEERLSSLIEQLDRLAGAVFRQTAGTLVELDLYAARRQDGAVSMDRANAIFLARIRDQLMGESVTFENNAELSWMVWPHLMMGFYMPGYIVGSAVATVLTQRVGANPGYIKVVEDLMAVGSSESLEDALQAIGIDIASTQFWDDVLAHGWYDKLRELEALLTRLGYHEG